MTPEFASFGDPNRFEIALRWRSDAEPRARRPAGYGWSVGDLKITIANTVITSSARGATRQQFVSWYLFPVMEWLANSWGRLLHEEEFAWAERSSAPAASIVPRRLQGLITARDQQGRQDYRRAQEWRAAHSLASAASGGLFPNLFIRRFLDTIELSWTAAAPLFAPDQFRFISEPGMAYLPVQAVAAPLWDALQWASTSSQEHIANADDAVRLASLNAKLEAIEAQTVIDFTACRIGRDVAVAAEFALRTRGVEDSFMELAVDGAPAIARFSPMVAMYGGLAPNLTHEDVETLSDVVVDARQRSDESKLLTRLIATDSGPPVSPPHIEGYQLATTLLDDSAIAPFVQNSVDIAGFLEAVGVRVMRKSLNTPTIRGVSLAGETLAPTIVVNEASAYNDTDHGVRFTLAHELAHLLYDRSNAASIGISSGPWAPASIEKRANAFAAMLLMPRYLVLASFGANPDFTDFSALAAAAHLLNVSVSTLVEHLANLDLIDEYSRDTLRHESRIRASGAYH
jgi:Zn-dependent peptidase ImmA (M78 family)